MTALVHETAKRLIPAATRTRYPSDSDKWVRAKPPIFFRLCRLRDFWQNHREDNFSQSDAIRLLLDFYDQFYRYHKDDFLKGDNHEQG